MNEEFVELLREEFHKRLERKTGWGKEELKLEFERAVSAAIVRLVVKERSRASDHV